jgi:ubiquinone/menaquinone biosynthesis C-methylase UbiE
VQDKAEMKKQATTDYTAEKHYFGVHADDYDDRRAQKKKWNHENEIVGNYLSKLLPGSRVLDVPVGTGRFIPSYIQYSLNVVGVDVSPDMIAIARNRHGSMVSNMDLRVARAEDLPFDNKSFDNLICNRFIKWLPSLEHVEQVMDEFRRVCRKEMLIQVKLARLDSSIIVSRLRLAINGLLGKKDAKRKTARYSMSEYQRVFAKNGWKISKTINASTVGPGVYYLVLTDTHGK